ncbi:hypothetical protein [Streptomyces noursei]|uniref:hypothetical protein n=1 Tax=Streptomyces noursei TaxID=1971 RepID=UPI0011DD4B2C|nr:hypothetical protein [Streptomyces noursei]
MQRLTWQLTQRRIGYSAGDLDAYEAGEHTREAAAERMRTWLPASRLLALALWRASRDAGLLIDDVPVTRALWWLGGARANDLFAEPLPSWDPGVVGTWPRLQQRYEALEEPARDIVAWHTIAHVAESRPYEDSDRSLPPPHPLLLGARCRSIAAGPYRDGQPPRWKPQVAFAAERLEEALVGLRSGLWHPEDDVRSAAAALHPTLAAGPGPQTSPLPDGCDRPTWIQRLCRIEHIHATILSVLDRHDDTTPKRSPQAPFGYALRALSVALADLLSTARELEQLWARRSSTIGQWERAHLPRVLREHVVALEGLVNTALLLDSELLAAPPD